MYNTCRSTHAVMQCTFIFNDGRLTIDIIILYKIKHLYSQKSCGYICYIMDCCTVYNFDIWVLLVQVSYDVQRKLKYVTLPAGMLSLQFLVLMSCTCNYNNDESGRLL